MVEVEHELLQIAFTHLAVTDSDVCFGHEFADGLSRLFDGLYGVVDEVVLSATPDFPQAGFAHHGFVPLQNEGLHGQTLRGRRRNQGQIAQAAHGHVQGPGNGRRGQCENVDLGAQSLEFFLVADPETMLLVDHHQAQVLEPHFSLQQSLCGDDDVDGACVDAREGGLRFLVAAKARQALDPNRPIGESVGEGGVVLLGEQGGGYEDGDLFAGLDGDEGGAQRDLGLAETHIAANDPVHRLVGLEIGEHLLDGGGLVGRFLEGKAGFKGAVFGVAGEHLRALPSGPARVQIQELRGDVANALRRLAARLLPLLAAQLMERRGFGRRTRVAILSAEMQRLHGNIQLVAVRAEPSSTRNSPVYPATSMVCNPT